MYRHKTYLVTYKYDNQTKFSDIFLLSSKVLRIYWRN